MAIMRLKEIKAMSSDDSTKKLGELRTELARMRTMIKAGGAVENPTRVRELRKTIAQILTIENEKKLGISQPVTKQRKNQKRKPRTPAKEAKKPKTEEAKETAPIMKVTPDIIRYEFIGTQAQVAKSLHEGYIGLAGKVIGETRNTFTLLR